MLFTSVIQGLMKNDDFEKLANPIGDVDQNVGSVLSKDRFLLDIVIFELLSSVGIIADK